MLEAYGHTDKGAVRPGNEDCFAIDQALQLLVVADGMGGHNAGEVAARLAVSHIVETIREYDVAGASSGQPSAVGADRPSPGGDLSLTEPGHWLRAAVYVASDRILEASLADIHYLGMGTTVVAALVRGNRVSVAHVGDSRLYLLKGGRLRALTRDDSWAVVLMAAEGVLDPLTARQHPMRNALTNVVGTRARPEVHMHEEVLTGGELILLSTDGVHGVLDDDWLARLLTRTGDLQETAKGLVQAALARGSRDNCTALVARYTRD